MARWSRILAEGIALASCLWLTPAIALADGGLAVPRVPGEALVAAEPATESGPGGTREAAQKAVQVARDTADQMAQALRGQSVQLGLGYSQNVAFFKKFKDLPESGVSANVTDNGRIAPMVQYSSQEKPIASFPLQERGHLTIGYNLLVTYDQFDLNRQLTDNFIVGKDLGTHLRGDYVAAAPLVFMRMGPLLPGSDIFWKLGGGLGASVIRFHGNVAATQGGATRIEDVSYDGSSLSAYGTIVWELQVNHWALLVKVQDVFGGGVPYGFSLEQYAMTVVYTLVF